MKQLLIFIIFAMMIYCSLIVLPYSIVYASLFILGAMLLAMYEWLCTEVLTELEVRV